jgi:hypothetical protein
LRFGEIICEKLKIQPECADVVLYLVDEATGKFGELVVLLVCGHKSPASGDR